MDSRAEADGGPVSGGGPVVGSGACAPVPVTVVAWCAGCRDEAEFVAPVGLADAGPDELACLQCGWAVLVAAEPPARRAA